MLFAYRSVVQESTKESLFFLLYGRDPRFPTGTLLDPSDTTYLIDADDYRTELLINLSKAQKLALESIKQAQEKQRTFYDRQANGTTFKTGDRVMVLMPSDTTGKNRKLARPYHGPYRIVNLTATNAEVTLIEYPKDPPIFVAIDRLRRCYLEQSDAAWTGRKRKAVKQRRKVINCQNPGTANHTEWKDGPVTRSMTRNS